MPTESARAISIRARLVTIARAENFQVELIFTRYVQERFLYRLAQSNYRDRLTLKGGLLLTAMTSIFARATRDIDFLSASENSEKTYAACIREIAGIEIADDGVSFDLDSVVVTTIMLQDEHSGLRAEFIARLGNARIRMQIDTGYGDQVLLAQESFVYPQLLKGSPEIIIRAYSVESIIAEKFEAIASIGVVSTRYKDYDDIVQLANSRQFRASALYAAVDLTYAKRGTSLMATDDAIASSKATKKREQQWKTYVSRSHAQKASQTLSSCLEILRTFWSGVTQYAKDGVDCEWNGRWDQIQ